MEVGPHLLTAVLPWLYLPLGSAVLFTMFKSLAACEHSQVKNRHQKP